MRTWTFWKVMSALMVSSGEPSPALSPLRGEIWLVEAQTGTQGQEPEARKVIVVSRDSLLQLPWRVVVPLSPMREQDAGYFWRVPLEDAPRKGPALGEVAESFQVTTLRLERFLERVGFLEPQKLQDLVATVALVVGHQGP